MRAERITFGGDSDRAIVAGIDAGRDGAGRSCLWRSNDRSRGESWRGDRARPPSWRMRALEPGFTGTFLYRNDNFRTGQNLAESLLTPSTVTPSQFGLLFTDAIDAAAYAQPLYVPNVSIPGQGTHNVVYVATENDSVYAFDADNPGPALWQTSFINPALALPRCRRPTSAAATWCRLSESPPRR